jgi:hypothetical protein
MHIFLYENSSIRPMGNIFPTTKDLEFWHSRASKTSMHRSTGTVVAYNNVCEYEGFACEIGEGNETGGLNFDRYEAVSIERFTKRNIFIDRVKGTEKIGLCLRSNEEGINSYTKKFKLSLPNDQEDVGKIAVLDEYKQELAIFYINH